MEEANQQLKAILYDGAKANDALPEVQNWLRLTIYHFADLVASQPTKEDRKEAIASIKSSDPLFYDDVKALAKKLYKERNKQNA